MDEYRQSLVGRALADVLQELEGNGNIDAKAGDTLFALFDAAVREDFAAAAPRKQKKKPSDDSEAPSENEDEPQQPRLFTHESMELHGRVESYNRFLDKWSVVAALSSEGSDNSDSLLLDKALVPLPSSSTRMLVKLHRPPPSYSYLLALKNLVKKEKPRAQVVLWTVGGRAREGGGGMRAARIRSVAPPRRNKMIASVAKNARKAVPQMAARNFAAVASAGTPKEVQEIGGFGQMTQPKLQLFGLHARYANALYSVAAKQNVLEAVEKELLSLEDTIAKEPNFAMFLKDPTIARASKKEDISKVMEAAKFSKPVAGLFEVLAENGRLPDAVGVIASYKQLMGAYRGEVQAKVTSADPLTKAQLDQVKKALGARIQKGETLLLEAVVDPEILGGLKVQIGNYFIDLSLSTKIDKINSLLVNSN